MIMDCSEQQQKCKKNNNIPYNQANRRHPPIQTSPNKNLANKILYQKTIYRAV